MPNAPNRRPRIGLLIVMAVATLIGLFVLGQVDPMVWTLVGWVLLAFVLAGIMHAAAPPHAAWPPALVALWTVAESWQSPLSTITSGLPFPWIVLILLADAFFAVATVAGVGYAAQCSRTGQPASWQGYRIYAAREVPRFAQHTLRTVRTVTQRHVERVK